MASSLALDAINELTKRSVVLDPMSGSGTVVRCAAEHGHYALAVDSDPLAVMMGNVWTLQLDLRRLQSLFHEVKTDASRFFGEDLELDWIDKDAETLAFTKFWFGEKQRLQLRAISLALSKFDRKGVHKLTKKHLDVIRIALSRTIITKESRASLARDTSHSRPHRVMLVSDYDVFAGFEKSFNQLLRLLSSTVISGEGNVVRGDARDLRTFCENDSVDLVVTSPPYLNAIDYMRGHKLSLVWFGYQLHQLRGIRSSNIGSEKASDNFREDSFSSIIDSMGEISLLEDRNKKMIARYAEDVYHFMSEIRRVLKPGAKAKLVVGDSCIRGVFVRNSEAVMAAGLAVGLKVLDKTVRDLPSGSRYLPTPKDGNPLSKRMKTECVLTLGK
jgi:DNA modification methylase